MAHSDECLTLSPPTHTPAATPVSASDPRVRKPLAAVAAVIIAATAVALVVFPVVVAVVLGDAPYERLHVGYPGVDVAVVTTVLLSGAHLATLVTSGAMVHVLFLRDAPARRARYLSDGFEISVLRVASGAWGLWALRTFGGGHGVRPPAARSMRSR